MSAGGAGVRAGAHLAGGIATAVVLVSADLVEAHSARGVAHGRGATVDGNARDEPEAVGGRACWLRGADRAGGGAPDGGGYPELDFSDRAVWWSRVRGALEKGRLKTGPTICQGFRCFESCTRVRVIGLVTSLSVQ